MERGDKVRILLANPFYSSLSVAGSSRVHKFLSTICYPDTVHWLTTDLDYRTGQKAVIDPQADYGNMSQAMVTVFSAGIYGKSLGRRALRELVFACRLCLHLMMHSAQYDVILISSPPLISVLGVPLARLLRKRVVLEIRDPWPDAIISHGVRLPRLVIGCLYWLERIGLRNADACIALTDGIAEMIAPKTQRPVYVVPNVASNLDGTLPSRKYDNRTKVVFAGSVGIGDGFPEFLPQVFAGVCEHRNISVEIYGDGPARFEAEFRLSKCPSVKVMGSVPKSQILHVLANADIAVLYTRPGLYSKIGLFNKFIDYLAAGLPIVLASCPEGSMARIVREWQCGCVVSNTDHSEMVGAILGLAEDPMLRKQMAENALEAARSLFDPEEIMKTYMNVIGGSVREAHALR